MIADQPKESIRQRRGDQTLTIHSLTTTSTPFYLTPQATLHRTTSSPSWMPCTSSCHIPGPGTPSIGRSRRDRADRVLANKTLPPPRARPSLPRDQNRRRTSSIIPLSSPPANDSLLEFGVLENPIFRAYEVSALRPRRSHLQES